MDFKITAHAYMRGKERMGWTPNQVRYYAEASLTRGKWMMDKTLWQKKCNRHGDNRFAYRYRGATFIFKNDTLITILTSESFSLYNKGKI